MDRVSRGCPPNADCVSAGPRRHGEAVEQTRHLKETLEQCGLAWLLRVASRRHDNPLCGSVSGAAGSGPERDTLCAVGFGGSSLRDSPRNPEAQCVARGGTQHEHVGYESTAGAGSCAGGRAIVRAGKDNAREGSQRSGLEGGSSLGHNQGGEGYRDGAIGAMFASANSVTSA